MNDDLHSVTLLAGNVCNVDHIMACLTYCLHEGKKKKCLQLSQMEREKTVIQCIIIYCIQYNAAFIAFGKIPSHTMCDWGL